MIYFDDVLKSFTIKHDDKPIKIIYEGDIVHETQNDGSIDITITRKMTFDEIAELFDCDDIKNLKLGIWDMSDLTDGEVKEIMEDNNGN